MTSSLYIHIPFCLSKCGYCSFSSYAGLQSIHDRYLKAVKKELYETAIRRGGGPPLETVFFGGGTPTVMPVEEVTGLLVHAEKLFGIAPDAEISIEANPGTVDTRYLRRLVEAGFNRLSLGVQSLNDAELTVLGRCHTANQAIVTVKAARNAGVLNLSLDLMYGLPGQTLHDWSTTLEGALRLAPEHLSLYQLTVEEGTPLADRVDSGALTLPDEDTIVAMDELNIEFCARAELELYEISNFARPGFRCRHNINYWQNGEYLAAGAGAVSYLAGAREKRIGDPLQYCRCIETNRDPIIEHEKLNREASFRETVVMGLRMTEGVDRRRLEERFGLNPVTYYGAVLEKLLAAHLLELTSTHLRVTDRGRLYSNIVLAELV